MKALTSIISFDDTAALPLTIMTAATGLYSQVRFGAGLRPPWEVDGRGTPSTPPLYLALGGTNVRAISILS